MKFGLKWVHMARHELILRLDGALWLTIIFETPLAPRRAMKLQNQQKTSFFLQGRTPPSSTSCCTCLELAGVDHTKLGASVACRVCVAQR